MESIQPQSHGLNIIAISPLILALKWWILIFAEGIYSSSLKYTITENWDVQPS